MAGLLDIPGGYWGDTTTKDPTTGLTQADRRDPLWAGLISGGMGLLAAGQDLRPEQRAQFMAQAGQTYGNIPAAMQAQKTAGAQQVLQAQQVKAGQSKLDTQARLAAMAKTPEFQEAVAKLEPDQRLLLQAALDSGDMAHATTILSSASRERTATAERARLEARADAKDAAKAKADAAKEGTLPASPDRAAHGYLLKGQSDPAFVASAEYAWAIDYSSRPQKLPDGSYSEPIDTTRYPKPTHPSAVAAGGGGGGGAEKTPAQLAQELDKGKEQTLPNGIIISKSQDGTIEWEVPGVGDRPEETWRQRPGGRPERQPVRTPIPSADIDVLSKSANTLSDLDELLEEMKKPGVQFGDISQYLSGGALDRTNPEGARARAIIAAIATKKVHDLSGAAVTDKEFDKLAPLIPQRTDPPDVVKAKVIGLRKELEAIGRARYQNLPANSKRVDPAIRERLGGKVTAQPTSRPAPDDAKPDGTPLWRHKDGKLYEVPE